MGIAYTAIPFLFFDTTHHTLVSHYSYDARALLLGWVFAMSPLGRLFGAPMLGKISDRWGRRKTLLLTVSMTLIANLLTAVSLTTELLWLLFVARFLVGLFAGNIAISQASLVDMSEKVNKTWRLNLLEIGMAAGLMLGPIIGARLMSPQESAAFNYGTPFYFIAFFTAILLILLWHFFKETVPEANLRTYKFQAALGQMPSEKQIHLWEGPKRVLQAIKTPGLRMLFLIWGLSMGGYTLYIEFFNGFLKKNLHFSAINLSNLSIAVAVFYIFYQVCIVYPLIKKFPAEKLVKPSLLLLGIFIALMGCAHGKVWLYVFRMAYMVAMVVFIPSFNAMVSNNAEKNAQGQTFGIMSAVYSFASLIIAIIGGGLAAISTATPVIIGGALIIVAGLLLLIRRGIWSE